MMERKFAIQTNFVGGELSEQMHARIDQQAYFSGVQTMENMVVKPHGGTYRRPGTKYVYRAKHYDRKCRLERFVFSASQAYVMEIGHQYIRFYIDNGIILQGGSPYEVATPYSEEEAMELQFVQSVDVLYIVHQNHPPKKLTRKGHTDWTLEDFKLKWGPFDPENSDSEAKLKVSALTGTGITVTASGTLNGAAFAPFAATDVGRLLAFRGASKWGYGKITAFTSSTVVALEAVEDFDGVADTPQAAWRLGSFHSVAGYPRAVCFHEDRLIMAGTLAQPQGVFASRSGQYDNFDDFDPTMDDAAMVFNLVASDLNMVMWLLSSKVLMAGTVAGEFRIGVLGATAPLTPKTVQCKRETMYGASKVPALHISDSVLFVLRSGARVREFTYQMFSYSDLASKDRSIRAEHLFRDSPIIDWAWQREPEGVLWCVREDGVLVGLTYMKDEEVYAWHRHPMVNGEVLSVTTLPLERTDDLWLAVKRRIDGEDRVYIERMEHRSDDTPEAYYVECGLTARGTDMTLISGLTHLVGHEVSIMADGSRHPNRVVNAEGQVDLDHPADVVHVGIPMRSLVKTLRYEYPMQKGTSQGMLVKISRAIVRFWKTGDGVKIGPDENHLDVVETRNTNDYFDRAVGLIDGDLVLSYPGGWSRNNTITIVQDGPMPMNILSVTVEATVVDR